MVSYSTLHHNYKCIYTLHHNYTVHWGLCYKCISTSWLTFFAATSDVPTTSPFSSKTSMPVFSSLFLISTTLHTLPVAEGQENEERGASRAIVSAATILTAHTYSESAPPNSVCSHSYVTSQYEWQSIFLLMAKWEAMPWMGVDARIGWMMWHCCVHWETTIIIIRSKKYLYVTQNARGKRATDHAEPHGLHVLHSPSCLKKIGDQHIGVFMAICWTQSHSHMMTVKLMHSNECVPVQCSHALTDCRVEDKPLNECPCGRRQGTGSSQDHTEANLRSGRGLGVTWLVVARWTRNSHETVAIYHDTL